MKQLPLARIHESLGAQFVDFANWKMPLVYTSAVEEHLAVREAVGLFDVSHMGEFWVSGLGAVDFLQLVTSNDITMLQVGDVQYSTVLNEQGGVKDDVLIYRTGERDFFIVCNAVNIEKLQQWFAQHKNENTTLQNISETTTMLALQGPRAQEVLQKLTDFDLSKLKRYKAALMKVAEVLSLVSRSGYTGEDGFELFIFDENPDAPTKTETLWKALLHAGKDVGIKPCGLGARDTARLEAGLCLYGHELTEDITPLEARIDFVVKFGKGNFIGSTSLLEQKTSGLKRVRIGLRMMETGVPRQGYEIFDNDEKIGVVTSGTFSPLLKVGIAMGYAKIGLKVGDRVFINIRDKKREAEIVNWPFYDPTRYGYSRR